MHVPVYIKPLVFFYLFYLYFSLIHVFCCSNIYSWRGLQIYTDFLQKVFRYWFFYFIQNKISSQNIVNAWKSEMYYLYECCFLSTHFLYLCKGITGYLVNLVPEFSLLHMFLLQQYQHNLSWVLWVYFCYWFNFEKMHTIFFSEDLIYIFLDGCVFFHTL